MTPFEVERNQRLVVDVLNRAIRLNRDAMTAVLLTGYEAGDELCDDPHIYVSNDYEIRGLGLITTVLAALGLNGITVGLNEEGEIVKFYTKQDICKEALDKERRCPCDNNKEIL